MNKSYKKTMKYFGYALLIALLSFFIYACWFVANFHGDTYGMAESYVLENIYQKRPYVMSSDIVDLLYDFQYTHPQYRLLEMNSQGEEDYSFFSKIENRSDQYIVLFYFEDIDMTCSCITEVTSRNHTLVKLYAVSEGKNFASCKRINNYREISRKENKKIKKKFETEILDNLHVKWRHKRFLNIL